MTTEIKKPAAPKTFVTGDLIEPTQVFNELPTPPVPEEKIEEEERDPS